MRTRRSQFSSDPMQSKSAAAKVHRSVLLHEVITSLALKSDDVVVDATLGGAGHARAIANELGKKGILIGFDLDTDAIGRARGALKGVQCRVELVNDDFRHLIRALQRLGLSAQAGISNLTKVLFDLGWSSYQLDSRLRQSFGGQAGRGFSFRQNEPLLMTYKQDPAPDELTAARIVNEWEESSIADVIFGWGEERYARRIARAIVEGRQRAPFKTSRELADVVKAAVPARYRYGRIHPATKTFQALRIAVNDELGALSEGLTGAWKMLAPRGRIAVITFHSLEDRIVKRQFTAWEKAGLGSRVNKKPITPSAEEIARNLRARSAKLRVIEKNRSA